MCMASLIHFTPFPMKTPCVCICLCAYMYMHVHVHLSYTEAIVYGVSTHNTPFSLQKLLLQNHKCVIPSHNNITLKHTTWHSGWNVHLKTIAPYQPQSSRCYFCWTLYKIHNCLIKTYIFQFKVTSVPNLV